jgi:putative FmdB family regulatory protein
MPTYEFRCPIGHEFEKFYRSIGKAEAEVACPECGQIAERMMSAGAGLVFKGSGFYLTDYGKNAHLKKNPADAKSEGGSSDGAKGDGAKSEGAKAESGSSDGSRGSDSASGSKSDAKPEPKAESKTKSAESKPAPAPPKPSASE